MKSALRYAFLIAASAAASVACAGESQNFPARPVRLVVATTSGSGPDLLARQIGARLAESWGQQVVVDPRPGASGLIGAELVARATPDGYTLWMITMTQLISTTLQQRFVVTREFAPVTMVATTPFVIATSAALPVNSIAELIEYAKQRPGKVLYGSGGHGSTPHLCMEIFQEMAGVKLLHVPYKGTTIAMTDMMGGQVHAACVAAPALQAFLKSGKLRALAVTTRSATPLVPKIPPVAQAVPGFELTGWYGVLAPRDTPKHIVARVNREIAKALAIPELQERLFALGAEASPSTPEEYGAFLRGEVARWGKVLKEAGIKPSE